jgi:arylsulfatase
LKKYFNLRVLLGLIAASVVMFVARSVPHVKESFASSRLAEFHAVEVEPTGGPNILFVCVDTLRADHVGLYGYARPTTPRIDAFFGRGRVYERAYAASPSTGPSVVSILTGLYPHRHGVRVLCQRITPDVITIVDHLRRSGYQTAAVVSNAVLADSASGLGERFDHYDDDVDKQEPFRDEMFERNAARTTDAAIRWMTELRHSKTRHFLWVHYIDPHGPYRPPDDKPVDFSHNKQRPIDPERVPTYSREPDVYDGNEYIDRYDEEIAYTDREVGRLLDAYAGLGLAEDALIIFTSDHGESMMEHEHWFRHERNTYEEMLHVPLMLRHPSIDPGPEPVEVSTIDLAPTVLAMAGLAVPPQLDAVNLLPRARQRDLLCEGRSAGRGLWRGLIQGTRKTSARHGRSNVIREIRAFELATDPLELSPRPVREDDPTYRFLERLIAADPDPGGIPRQYDEGDLPSPNVAPTADPRLLRRLRQLGYVGDP